MTDHKALIEEVDAADWPLSGGMVVRLITALKEAVARAEKAEDKLAEKFDYDINRVNAWLANKDRSPANTAFTAGATRSQSCSQL